MKHILWIALLALAACNKPSSGGSPGSSTSSSSAPTDETPASGSRVAPKSDPNQPRIYVTANDSDAPQIPAGWPLILKVSLRAPSDAPLKIAATSGSWSSLLQLTPPGDAWKLRAVEFSAPSITLDAASSGLLVWTMTAAELDAIPRGTYRIEALLKTGTAPEGAWSGVARGSPAVITLVKAITKPTPEQDVERSRLVATVLHLRGDNAGAEKEADALVKRFPKHTGAILLRADVLEVAGKRAEAITFLDATIETIVGKTPTAENWPKALVDRRAAMAAMEKK